MSPDELGQRAGRGLPAATSSTAHDWQAGLAPAYVKYGADRPRAHGRHRPQPRVPGLFRLGDLPPALPARPQAASESARVLSAASATSRPGSQRADVADHRQPDLRARNPHRRLRHGPRRPAAGARRTTFTASSTASTPTIWDPCDGPGAAAALQFRDSYRAARRPTSRALDETLRPRRQRRVRCSASSAG